MDRTDQIREQAQSVLDTWFSDWQDNDSPHSAYKVVALRPPPAPGTQQFIELRPRDLGDETERYMIEMRVVRIP